MEICSVRLTSLRCCRCISAARPRDVLACDHRQDVAKRAFPWTSRERFPSGSTVAGDLGERLQAQRFPVFCDTEEVTGSNPVAPTRHNVSRGSPLSTTAALLAVVDGASSDCDEHEPDDAGATMTSQARAPARPAAARPAGTAAGGSRARSTGPAARPVLRAQPPPVPTVARVRWTARNAWASIDKVTCRYQAW